MGVDPHKKYVIQVEGVDKNLLHRAVYLRELGFLVLFPPTAYIQTDIFKTKQFAVDSIVSDTELLCLLTTNKAHVTHATKPSNFVAQQSVIFHRQTVAKQIWF